jgi:bile acid:Na+ symporter, BASS family
MDLKTIIVLALKASILLTVFSFGLQATKDDLLCVVRRPGHFVRALLALFVIMPVVAILLVKNFGLLPPVKIALVALAISPIPPLLPRKTGKAGGHPGFALGLMATAAVLAIFLIPLTMELLERVFGLALTMTAGAVAKLAFMTVLLPLLAGIAFRAVAPAVAEKIAKPIGAVAGVLLALGALVILVAVLPGIKSLIGSGTVISMVVFVIVGLAAGHFLGGPDPDKRTVLGLSTACRHPGIAFAIGVTNFPNERLVPAAVLLYLLVSAVVCIPYVNAQKRRVAEAVPAA